MTSVRSSLSPTHKSGFQDVGNNHLISTSPNKTSPQKAVNESEINALVHNALVRAREATKSNNRPLVPNLTIPNVSPSLYFRNLVSSPSSPRPFDEINSPRAVEVGEDASVGSIDSNEDIIRRVEEEIAKAQKAAKEATRRLAGVSANFMAEVENCDPHESRGTGNSKRENDDNVGTQRSEIMTERFNGSSSSSSSDEIIACRSETIASKKTSTSDTLGIKAIGGSRSTDKFEPLESCSEDPDNLSTADCDLSKEEIEVFLSIINDEKKDEDEMTGGEASDIEVSRNEASETQHETKLAIDTTSNEKPSLNQDQLCQSPVKDWVDSMTKGLGGGDSDDKNWFSGIKSAVDNIYKSFDDVPMDELEAVLSDERDEDLRKKGMNETCASENIKATGAKMEVDEHTSDDVRNSNHDRTEVSEASSDLEEKSVIYSNEREDYISIVTEKKKAVLIESNADEKRSDDISLSDDEISKFNEYYSNIIKENSNSTNEDNDEKTSDIACDAIMVSKVTDNKSQHINHLLGNLTLERNQVSPTNGSSSDSATLVPKQLTTPDIGDRFVPIVHENLPYQGKKVNFKQRYPIPQKIKQSRQPSEIMFDYQLDKPNDKLWQSMPKKDLKELLEAATGSSTQRRSNACGALKVLSTQKKNQLTLVRTAGFMDALVSVIGDDYSIEDKDVGTAAKTRAVNIILNVSTKKDNRYHVLMHPGVRKSLVECIINDKGEIRELACASLATLAKTPHCREPMAQTEKLVDTLATVLKKRDDSQLITVDHEDSFEEERSNHSRDDERSDHSRDDDVSRTSSSIFSSSTSSSSTNSSFGESSTHSEIENKALEIRMRTRMNACAALSHLSKECSISQHLCASDTLLHSLVLCCKEVENPIHTKCLEILANLTRFPHNNARLVEYPGLVDSLIVNGSQEDDCDRLWAMRIIQNLSSEPSAKAKLASPSVLELLSTNMMRKKHEEQLAATSIVYNISTEPGAVVPLTNTKNVVATLVHVAHSPTSVMEVRTIACDALATLGLWLQTLASSGNVPEGVKDIPLPTYITSGWQRWDE